MSKVIAVNTDPKSAATTFYNFARKAMLELETKFRKEWLERHYAYGDAQRASEGVFTTSGNRDTDLEWIRNFYSNTRLRWYRAEQARRLIGQTNQITEGQLNLFLEDDPQFEYKDIPSEIEMRRVVDSYYSKIQSKGIIGGIRSFGTRTGRPHYRP